MLPSSHLMIGESPQAAAERILKEQLGLPALPLKGPFVFSEVYGPQNHWDLGFIFVGERDQVGQHPVLREVSFVDGNATPREEMARYHEDILAHEGAGLSPGGNQAFSSRVVLPG